MIMLNEKTINMLEEEVKKKLGIECTVQFQEVKKNNEVSVPAIIIKDPGAKTCPVIYIDGMLQRFKEMEIGICEMAFEIAGIYKSQCNTPYINELVGDLDKETILNKVTYKIVNREKNAAFLSDKPIKGILDLAAFYTVIINEYDYGSYSMPITHAICRMYGINEEELDMAARRNTEKQGFIIESIESVLALYLGTLECEPEETSPMTVLTNFSHMNGATVMLYTSYFEELSDRLESDLFILPSSIHEVLALPAEGYEPESLMDIVRCCNADTVSAEEVLSENVYLYSREKRRLELI